MSDRITANDAARLRLLAQVSCGFISRLMWSPDGSTLAAAHGEGIWLWEGSFSGSPTRRLNGHDAPVKDAVFSPDGVVIASGSADATTRLWDVAAGHQFHVMRKHSDTVNAVAFNANGRLLASAGGDQRVVLLDLNDSAQISVMAGHIREISCLAFAGDTLASGGWDKTLWLWDTGNRRPRATIPMGDWIRDIATSPDGQTLAVACKDGTLKLVDVASATIARVIHAHERGVDAVAFSPDGRLLLTGGRDNFVRLWDLNNRMDEPLVTLVGGEKPVLTVAFHPNGSTFVTGSGNHIVRMWGMPVGAS